MPAYAAVLLRDRGIEAWHVFDLDMMSQPDDSILEEALRRGAVVTCYDSDFHKLLALTGACKPSVIRVRIDKLKGPELADLLAEIIGLTEQALRSGVVLTVKGNSIRGRPLPLKGHVSSSDQPSTS